MIGVAVQPADRDVVGEFFELFKTPWEFADARGRYDVLICTIQPWPQDAARLVLAYGAELTPFDTAHRLAVNRRVGGTVLTYAGRALPIYGAAATFPAGTAGLVQDAAAREPAVHAARSGDATIARIGYDLFAEVRHLLTAGQPAGHAGSATLELHIALLRELITRAGLPVVEIPPAPAGHDLIACLTHDMDHPILRNHFCDHAMFGFLLRATLGSLVKVGRGRMALADLGRNWWAAVRLPFVYLGLAPDFWGRFDRYLEIEAGLGATYFVIPRPNDPGHAAGGPAPALRACRYRLPQLKPQFAAIMAAGNEVALHGLDAWRDAGDGRREREEVSRTFGPVELGVRMHWLYFDGNSPAALDRAGFTYDSTVGYNETVGYRAGTTQVYRPPGTTTLLELPLHVMDTALFYPDHLNLSDDEALRRFRLLLEDFGRFGGVLTINWHDRSIAPERLWTAIYLGMIRELKDRRAWFPTAAQAVAWFRKRRAAAVESVQADGDRLRVRVRLDKPDALPSLRLRVHKPLNRTATEPLATGPAGDFLDARLDESTELTFAL